MKDNHSCKCISDILKVILILQRKANLLDREIETCDRKTLGCNCRCKCNTRPIQLFLVGHNGDDPLIMPITKGVIDDTTMYSNVFKVEKVDNHCATFRVLIPEKVSDDEYPRFIASNSLFTLDLSCVCAIKCLNDTYVE